MAKKDILRFIMLFSSWFGKVKLQLQRWFDLSTLPDVGKRAI
jgi:hypothetical protein